MRNSNEVRKVGIENMMEQLNDKSLPVDWKFIAETYDRILSTEFAAYQQVGEVLGSFKEFMTPKEWEKLTRNKDAMGPIGKGNISFLKKNLYNLTPGKRLSSRRNELFKKIREKNPNINPRDLKRFFVRIEKPYYSRRLSLDAPEPVELEE